jgi:hypothetical protein
VDTPVPHEKLCSSDSCQKQRLTVSSWDASRRQINWLRSMRRDAFVHYQSIRENTERYITSRTESLVGAIIRTMIANHDVEFPASRQTISMTSSWFRTLRLSLILTTQTVGNTLARRLSGRQFALSTLGFMLLVPDGAEPGDSVVIFGDARMAYLLRDPAKATLEHTR